MSADEPLDSAPATTPHKPMRKTFVRRSARVAMQPEAATRQGRAATVAWEAFGDRDAAVAYLNNRDDTLGGRPIDIAIASAHGLVAVEASIAARAQVMNREGAANTRSFGDLGTEPSENPDRGQAAPSITDPSMA